MSILQACSLRGARRGKELSSRKKKQSKKSKREKQMRRLKNKPLTLIELFAYFISSLLEMTTILFLQACRL